MENYFKTLGLDETATEAEIEQAYQQLRKNNTGSKFSKYDCAYAMLKDPKLRAIHLNTLNLRLNNSTEKIGESEVDSLPNNIELLDQKISDIKGGFNTPIADEYKAKLNSLHKEREEVLKRISSQRTHAIQTRLKTSGVDDMKREVNIQFSKKESQLKQQYKGKLLVEYIGNLPKQLELEKLMRDRRELVKDQSVVQCVYIDPDIKKKHR